MPGNQQYEPFTHPYGPESRDDVDPSLRERWNQEAIEDHLLALGPDAGWITPTFLNGWAAAGAPWAAVGYRKVGPLTVVSGSLYRSTGITNDTLFTLPAKYRPRADFPLPMNATAASNGVLATITGRIFANGNVRPTGYDAYSNSDFTTVHIHAIYIGDL